MGEYVDARAAKAMKGRQAEADAQFRRTLERTALTVLTQVGQLLPPLPQPLSTESKEEEDKENEE